MYNELTKANNVRVASFKTDGLRSHLIARAKFSQLFPVGCVSVIYSHRFLRQVFLENSTD